jgi:hypothetical protein
MGADQVRPPALDDPAVTAEPAPEAPATGERTASVLVVECIQKRRSSWRKPVGNKALRDREVARNLFVEHRGDPSPDVTWFG